MYKVDQELTKGEDPSTGRRLYSSRTWQKEKLDS